MKQQTADMKRMIKKLQEEIIEADIGGGMRFNNIEAEIKRIRKTLPITEKETAKRLFEEYWEQEGQYWGNSEVVRDFYNWLDQTE